MGFLAKAASWIFGGGGAQTVAKVVDEAHYSGEEKAADDAKDLANARAFAAPTGQPGLLNQVVDAVNRAIRPWVTIELFMRWFGYRPFPDIKGIDPFWVTITMIVLTFWFGGRVLLRDIPGMVRAIRGK